MYCVCSIKSSCALYILSFYGRFSCCCDMNNSIACYIANADRVFERLVIATSYSGTCRIGSIHSIGKLEVIRYFLTRSIGNPYISRNKVLLAESSYEFCRVDIQDWSLGRLHNICICLRCSNIPASVVIRINSVLDLNAARNFIRCLGESHLPQVVGSPTLNRPVLEANNL